MDLSEMPINQARRSNRVVDDQAWIKTFLHNASFGVLGTDWQGQPFVKPTTFVYHETDQALYFHGALEGRTRSNLEANPKASFCVSEMGRLLPAKTAGGFGVEFASVVVFGKVSIVKDEAQAAWALQLLLDKYFPTFKPGQDYQPVISAEVNTTAVYRFEIETWSGKQRQAPPDYPQAFYYPLAGASHVES